MTDTLTDRERELVEAARCVLNLFIATGGVGPITMDAVKHALRAYDPPKVKKYTVPDWENAPADGAGSGYNRTPQKLIAGTWFTEVSWNILREALATEE